VHRLFGQQDQNRSADISTLNPAATPALTPERMIMAVEAVSDAVPSFNVHHRNLLLMKTLS
jgi:hypothetical protein